MSKKMTTVLKEGIGNHMVLACGIWDAYSARLSEMAGFEAVHLSGWAHETTKIGRPDLGIQTLTELVMTAARITDTVNIPVMVDVDTGYGGVLNVQRTIREMERAGVAGVHIEDQIVPKRCPTLGGSVCVSTQDAVDRVKAAVDARTDTDFVISARTDYGYDGFDALIDRCNRFLDAGATMAMPDYLFISDRKPYFSMEPDEQMELRREVNTAIKGPVMDLGCPPPKGYTNKDLEDAGIAFHMYAGEAVYAYSNAVYEMMRTIIETGNVNTYFEEHPGKFSGDWGITIQKAVYLDECEKFSQEHLHDCKL